MKRPCGCKETLVVAGQVVRVDTCPVCLPAGAISWLIENGRQLDMFEALAPEAVLSEVDSTVSVSGSERGASSMLTVYKTQGLCSCDLPF